MSLLPEQRDRAVKVMEEFVTVPLDRSRADQLKLPNYEGRIPVDLSGDFRQDRADVIKRLLEPLVEAYLSGAVPLDDFKKRVGGISKSKSHNWFGFSGPQGMMFATCSSMPPMMLRNVIAK